MNVEEIKRISSLRSFGFLPAAGREPKSTVQAALYILKDSNMINSCNAINHLAH
jgi:hypothetical protein